MPSPPSLNPPHLISDTAALTHLLARLANEPKLSVDTESNSLYAYHERVCLIQISVPEADFLIDPLALDSLEALGELFANPNVEKIFHAAEYDLICLQRDYGFTFANLFDTMVAGRILGWEEVGLAAILEKNFGVTLDKHFQLANWGHRPLPNDMLVYAQLDTHYLIALSHQQKSQLVAAGRWQLAQEDFDRLAYYAPRNRQPTPDPWMRITGASELSPRQATVLQKLWQYRDRVARTKDVPPFKVISHKALFNIATSLPRNRAELFSVPGLSQRLVQNHSDALLEAIGTGLKAELYRPARSARPSDEFLARLEALQTWRKTMARRMGVNSDVVLPRDLLAAIATQNPTNEEQLAEILHEVPWRWHNFGKELLNVLIYCGKG